LVSYKIDESRKNAVRWDETTSCVVQRSNVSEIYAIPSMVNIQGKSQLNILTFLQTFTGSRSGSLRPRECHNFRAAVLNILG